MRGHSPTGLALTSATGPHPAVTPLGQCPRGGGFEAGIEGLMAGAGGLAAGARGLVAGTEGFAAGAGVSAAGASERLMTPSSSLRREGPRSRSRRKDRRESERRSSGSEGKVLSRSWSRGFSERGRREMVQNPESRPGREMGSRVSQLVSLTRNWEQEGQAQPQLAIWLLASHSLSGLGFSHPSNIVNPIVFIGSSC